MKTHLYEGKYIGADGSLGYKKDTVYIFRMWTDLETIIISRTDNTGMCPYNTIHTFFANWCNVKKV